MQRVCTVTLPSRPCQFPPALAYNPHNTRLRWRFSPTTFIRRWHFADLIFACPERRINAIRFQSNNVYPPLALRGFDFCVSGAADKRYSLCFEICRSKKVGIEYKIKFLVPPGYDPGNLFKKLPNPIHRPTMTEIYSYGIEKDGFYFLDALVDKQVASIAFRMFVDEALLHAESIEIIEL